MSTNLTTVQVFDNWLPAGLAGDKVTIDVGQTLVKNDGVTGLLTTTGPNSIYLKLQAPQVDLPPADLIGVYPAGRSTTSPDEYLPHMALNRYTLPWERVGPAPGKPWLALILYKASDWPAGSPAAIGLTKLPSPEPVGGGGVILGPPGPPPSYLPPPVSTGTTLLQASVAQIELADIPGYKQMTGAAGIPPSTQVNVLYLPNSVWQNIQPELDDLELLCHIRIDSRDSASGAIIGNRLPSLPADPNAAPEPHTAVLVSLEQRSDLFGAGNTRKPTDTVALIGLYQWTFTPSSGRDFADAIQAISYAPNGGVLRFGNLPAGPEPGTTAPLTDGFAGAIGADGYLLTPITVSPGGQGMYRGPLRPFTTPVRENTFAVHSAPQDFTAAPDGTPPDYSYAAAFELGRMTALSDAGIIEDLREVHGYLDLPKQFFGVSTAMPAALMNKSWLPDGDSDWYTEPWAGMTTELAPPPNADVSGIAQQVGSWVNSIGQGIQGVPVEPGGLSGVSMNIATVDAATLAAEFSDVIVAAQ